MATKPAFVFVPGAWHTAETWTKVTSALVTQGYESVSVTLPTTSGDASASFVEDVKATRNAIEAQLSQKRDVIVVVHSYGGVVGQSAMKDLTSVSSLTGRIIGLVVIASGYAQPGMAFLDGTGGTPPPTWRLHPSGFAELQVPAQALFYDDLPQAEADEWTAKLTKQSTRAFTEGREVTYPGWKDVPVWHLITTEDKALPVDVQRMLVGMVKDQISITVREIPSSHSPMLSKPKDVLDFILEATAAFTKH